MLVLGEGPNYRLNDSLIKAEVKYSINFTEYGKQFMLSLNYNGSISFSVANATKISQIKQKDSKLKPNIVSLGNIL